MSALSSLPLNETDLSPLFKFVSQVGDYSLTVAKQSIAGNSPTNEERENLNNLSIILRAVLSRRKNFIFASFLFL